MANGAAAFNLEDLTNAVYESLIEEGVDPGDAARIAEAAVQNSSLDTAAVVNYLNQAWNLTPANLPAVQRAYYALAILTAMRGNPLPWDKLKNNPATFQPWMATVKIPNVNPEDNDLAFAQHYMHERYVVGRAGDPEGAKGTAVFYDWLKQNGFRLPGTTNKPSAPGPASVWWAVAGALKGQQDYEQSHPGDGGVPMGSLQVEFGQIPPPGRKSLGEAVRDVFGQVMKLFSNLPVGQAATACSGSFNPPDASQNVTGTLLSPASASPPPAGGDDPGTLA
jgi:hypothetical protein